MPIVTTVAILPMLLIFYLLDYEMIGEKLRSIVPQKHEKDVAELGSRLNRHRRQLPARPIDPDDRDRRRRDDRLQADRTRVLPRSSGCSSASATSSPISARSSSAIPPIIYAFIAGTGANPGPGP
ncbi:MAG: hypothetical protein MZU97_11740 [Bacillus subtilis]|nr:hypothetical protein [Bacillus subtilis]